MRSVDGGYVDLGASSPRAACINSETRPRAFPAPESFAYNGVSNALCTIRLQFVPRMLCCSPSPGCVSWIMYPRSCVESSIKAFPSTFASKLQMLGQTCTLGCWTELHLWLDDDLLLAEGR